MKYRCLSLFGGLLAIFVVAAAAPMAGQAPRTGTAVSTYTQPRTAWGDPDLQGWFSNLSENGTPMERPNQFAGRQLEDVKGEELTALKVAAQNSFFLSGTGMSR